MPITLWIPDLAPACAERAVRRRLTALETLLARAQAQPVDEAAALAEIFGLSPTQLAPAPFMRLADGGVRDAAFYFCAAPVHLAPDRDQLVMLPLAVMQVFMQEAAALAEAFNRHYGADGYRLETPCSERWYLHCPEPFECVTHAPAQVQGAAVMDYMPAGTDGLRLRQFMNEVQMLFYEHPVNQAREAAGRPAINSLWLWGGGRLPEGAEPGPEYVVTDIPLVEGLARFAGSNCTARSAPFVVPHGANPMLIGVRAENQQQILQLEEQLAVPLLRALRRGETNELNIYPGNRRKYSLRRPDLRRFWHRRRPLAEALSGT